MSPRSTMLPPAGIRVSLRRCALGPVLALHRDAALAEVGMPLRPAEPQPDRVRCHRKTRVARPRGQR